ncbi:BCL2 modifying factor 1 isoform 1-T1 [Clarias gariepinus]|uniref:BCL2 modifying factor 1 isoform X1 n=2 Tax=Clarias gariepinus TaxID=13013 RepID=UPI00234C890B|nr:BCL2 modifying factor 1 isoform X1 [Clarias gariepinus]
MRWRRCKILLMEEDEDDVFGPVSQCWPSSNREIKQEDHSTQTPGSPVARLNGMLPCGVADEPRRLFYGSAGLLLLTPSARTDRVEGAMFPENQPHRRPAHSVEAQIGQKLQMIGDQFYQEHMLQHQNQRNQWPFWLRLASALYTLLFNGEPAVHRRRPEDRR